MAEDTPVPATSSASPRSDPRDAVGEKTEKPSALGTIAIVLAIAGVFALVPRVSRGCEGTFFANEPAPDFTGRVIANPPSPEQTAIKMSELKGHPVILDFWATWCGPCQAEAPIVNGIAQRYRDRGLVVVGVNTSDEAGLAERFVKKKNLSFPIVFDEGNTIAKSFNVANLPTLVVIDKEGKVIAIRQGVTSDAALDDLVKRVL